MIKGYIIEYNVTCVKTGAKYPDAIIPSGEFGDTFTEIMKNAKVGDTSILENLEGIHWDNGIRIPCTYDQMFVVTSIE